MKKIIFLILIILNFVILLTRANDKDLFKVTILLPKDAYILGEPITINIKVTYLGKNSLKLPIFKEISVHVEGVCDNPKPAVLELLPPQWWKKTEEIQVGWSYNKIEDISWCINKPKNLKVQGYMSFNPPFNDSNEIWKGHVNSEWKAISIMEPSGLDKQAYEELSKAPLAHPKELLNKYPTSTYAGWVLLSMSYVMNLDLEKELNGKMLIENKIKNLPSGSEKLMYEKNISKDIEFHNKRIEILEKYILAVPNHSAADWFVYEIAHHYGYLENWNKSLFWAEKALAINQASEAANKATILIAFIEKRVNK